MATLLIYAGAEGSGKTTITAKVPIVGKYVNADDIKIQLGCADFVASMNAEATCEYFIGHKMDFTFENELSTERGIAHVKRANANRYHTACVYVLTKHPDINVARVAKRISLGGDDVAEEDVRAGYVRALKSFPQLIPIFDELYVFDNSLDSKDGEPSLILHSIKGKVELHPNELWSKEMIQSLIQGQYAEKYI